MLGTKRFLHSLKLKNLLSFGSKADEIEFKSLNVLIGSNASGKSNIIDAISLLRSTAGDMQKTIREGGGIAEWLWKGESNPVAEIEAIIEPQVGTIPLQHKFSFTMTGQKFELVDEVVEDQYPFEVIQDDVRFYYRYNQGLSILNFLDFDDSDQTDHRTYRQIQLPPNKSIISLRGGSEFHPEIVYLSNNYFYISIYKELDFGRSTPPRLPQQTDLPEDFLLEDAGNLGLILNDLEHRGLRTTILEKLKEFHNSFENLSVKILGGTVQLFVHEENLKHPIPATRLSDGTLRYLCLISILCHPTPPPLICIEEPEIGLHPDILPALADMMIEASHRTQLIVTTHSDILIDALTEVPEAVAVCEKHEGSTTVRRLDADDLKEWLEKYRLGQLWLKGELGGTRW